MKNHIEILREEFNRRVEKNPRYSLRAFAANLGVHPSALSRIFSGKQNLSSQSSVNVVKRLGLDADKTRNFLISVVRSQMGSELEAIENDLTLRTSLDAAQLIEREFSKLNFSLHHEKSDEVRRRVDSFISNIKEFLESSVH